ncbi:unnamed protein product [Spirodela intermedia]|uniref:Beta-amylase n=1 Tax=Spirodela intermedia TaxID=51605 RepID=A0A7I8L8S0_SPIIN|nr:unnamed protein product [Spirodela intermedia]
MGKYDWSGYLALVQMIQDSGLLVRASLYTHWVSTVGEADPSVFFTDRAGNLHRECLSLSADDLPVLEGKTPLEVYRALLQSFRDTFSSFLGSTITDVLVGLGPDGELKYPSMPASRNRNNMLGHLKLHAEATGNHFWGLSGPHDAPSYNQSPDSGTFFKDAGGSWETPYGDFFLSWYSGHLLAHGDRVLSMASAVLGDLPVQIHGKLPVMHAWSKSRSHPTELAAGLYNTVNRDGYDAIADMFARNSCGMILPSMDLADELQPAALRASPESLLSQIMRACNKHGVAVTGENSSVRGPPEGFVKIRDTLSRGRRASSPEEPVIAKFTYQRMGAYFFSPEHFPAFTQFVRSLEWSELHSDDLPAAGGETIPLTAAPSPKEITTRQMQTA